jgi:hypothetical protein
LKQKKQTTVIADATTITQGEWRAVQGHYIPEVRAAIRKDYCITIASCAPGVSAGATGSYILSKEEAMANAKLCAAAPKMLELLKEIAKKDSEWTHDIKKVLQAL